MARNCLKCFSVIYDDSATWCPKCGVPTSGYRADDVDLSEPDDDFATMTISTGGVCWPYQVLDTIVCIGVDVRGFFESGANLGDAFDDVKKALRTKCAALGGDAIINCSFDYRVALAKTWFGGKRQAIELFAYGTAVRKISEQ